MRERLSKFGHLRRRRAPSGANVAFALPAAAFMAALSVYPLYSLGRMSLSAVSFDNILGHWRFTGLANVRALFGEDGFSGVLQHTGLFVLIVVVGSLVGGMIAALLIARRSRPTRIVEALLIFAWMLPPVVTGSIWKFLFYSDGAVNGILKSVGGPGVLWLIKPGIVLYAVAFVNAWAALPFAAIVLKAGLVSIPRDTQEAAAVDGANSWKIFWQVTLPQLFPVIAVLVVIVTVYAFRSFDFIYVMTQGGPGTASMTLPYLAYRDAFTVGLFGRGAAAAMVSGAVIAIAAVVYVRLTRKFETRR
jgi:multiple sugar transport system permease protein